MSQKHKFGTRLKNVIFGFFEIVKKRFELLVLSLSILIEILKCVKIKKRTTKTF